MSVGKRLREERERLGFTQVRLAELGKVSKRSQIDYEQDKIEMKAGYLAELFAAGIDVIYVLSGKHSLQSEATDAEQFLLATFRRLDMYAKDGLLILFERLAAVKYLSDDYPKWRTPKE